MVLDVPKKTPFSDDKCCLKILSISAVKLIKPLKIPGFAEVTVSSWPRNANSKLPQNFTQSIIRFKIYLLGETFSLCSLTDRR
jgi:hypothetical protein